METKIEIKEKPWWFESTPSPQVKLEVPSSSEEAFHNSCFTVQSDTGTATTEMETKIEIKEESLGLESQQSPHMKSEVTPSSEVAFHYSGFIVQAGAGTTTTEMETKIEIKEEFFGLESHQFPHIKSEVTPSSEVAFHNSGFIVQSDTRTQTDTKIQTKEEALCLERSPVESDDLDLKDVKSLAADREQELHFLETIRLHTEGGPCGEHEGNTSNITEPHPCVNNNNSSTQISDLKNNGLIIHDDKSPHNCKICGKTFTTSRHLKTHNLIHEGKRPHKCNVCGTGFTKLSDLKRHNLIHEGTRPHKCKICGKTFTRASHVKEHNLIHEGKKLHKCNVCERSFIRASDFKKHNLTHGGKRPHKCNVCGKSFIQASHLKDHILVHLGKRSYKCNVCGESYIKASDLRTHNLIHEGRQPFNCNVCGKSFTRASNLREHNFIHEGKSPHKCNVCGKSFSNASYIGTHNLIHEGRKPHKCNVCGKSFTTASQLKRHTLIHK